MASTQINTAMLSGLRQHIVDMVSYAGYRIDGVWHRAEIDTKAVQGNGAVHVTFYVHRAEGSASPATAFRLMNADGQALAMREETIEFAQHMDAVLYRFKFGVSVGETPST